MRWRREYHIPAAAAYPMAVLRYADGPTSTLTAIPGSFQGFSVKGPYKRFMAGFPLAPS
jgi:hypothetical protein